MFHFTHASLVIVVLLLSACSSVNDDEKAVSSIPDGMTIKKNVQVTMRDGARLNTQVYLPTEQSDQAFPTILIRTPYKNEVRFQRPIYQAFIENGYAIVMQHERGRYFSEGEFRMLGGALEDGVDTLDWISTQPWSNGDIGTYGCSSSGENQLKLASAKHPSHKAMVIGSSGVGVAEAGPFREQGNFWRGGAWQQGWMNYFHQSMFQDWPQLPKALSDEERQELIGFFDLNNKAWEAPSSVYNETRMHLPMIDIMDQLTPSRNEVKSYLMAGPFDDSWSELRVSEGEQLAIPGLWFESLYDISARSAIAFFEWNRQANAAQGNDNQRIRITQGGHCSFGRTSVETAESTIGDLSIGDMRYDYVQDVISWFNFWLKGETSSAIETSAYTAYVGDGKWLNADALPMSGNQTWYLGPDQQLSKTKANTGTSITYTYDPNDPVPSLGGEIYGEGDDHFDGSFDQTPLHSRQDVLVFTSEELTEDLTLFGLSNIVLSLSSDQPDTDLTVKINEVYADGKAYNLGDTILRMRYREGIEQEIFMQEDEVYTVELPPIMLSKVIAKGHRLQVEVSSSNFPAYSRNLNTSGNPYTTTETAVAQNTLFIGDDHASYIKLPVR